MEPGVKDKLGVMYLIGKEFTFNGQHFHADVDEHGNPITIPDEGYKRLYEDPSILLEVSEVKGTHPHMLEDGTQEEVPFVNVYWYSSI